MVASLQNIARQHTSVVAVIGRGHLSGIATNWKEDICVSIYLFPLKQPPSKYLIYPVRCRSGWSLGYPPRQAVKAAHSGCAAVCTRHNRDSYVNLVLWLQRRLVPG